MLALQDDDQQKGYADKFVSYFQAKLGVDGFSALIMFISSFLWPSAYIYANEHDFSFPTTLIIRGFSVCMFSFVLCIYLGYPINCQDPQCFRYLMLRNILMCFHGAVTAYSQFYLPLPIVHAVSSVGPGFGIILDFLVNGTRMTKNQLYGVVASLVGVNMVLNGDLLLSFINPDYQIQSDFGHYRTKSTFVMFLVSLLLIICIACWAYAVILTKMVGMNSTQINFYAGFSMMVCGVLFTPTHTPKAIDLESYAWSYLYMGFLFVLTTATFSIAILYCENIGKILTVSNNIVLVSYLISVFRYNQSINPISGLGSLVLVGGISAVLLSRK